MKSQWLSYTNSKSLEVSERKLLYGAGASKVHVDLYFIIYANCNDPPVTRSNGWQHFPLPYQQARNVQLRLDDGIQVRLATYYIN